VIKQGEKRINREKILSRQGKQKSQEVSVEFTYHAPEARQVYVVGEFSNWDLQSIPMRKITEGPWKASVTLNPGRYEYKYFADGSWVDGGPDAEKAQNTFGTNNLVVYV
jgi:1,4-alpha-glucan branching enzyme